MTWYNVIDGGLGELFPKLDGFYDIVGGYYDGQNLRPINENTFEVTPEMLAEMILHREDYHGEDVRLLVDFAAGDELAVEHNVLGRQDDSFAAHLSRELGVNVLAPDLRVFVSDTGEVVGGGFANVEEVEEAEKNLSPEKWEDLHRVNWTMFFSDGSEPSSHDGIAYDSYLSPLTWGC